MPEMLNTAEPYPPSDGGSMSRRMAIGLGVGAGVVALVGGAFLAVKDALPNWLGSPGYVATPDNSEVVALQEVLEKRENDCNTVGVWNHAESAARLISKFSDPEDPEAGTWVGRDVVAERLKSVDETCLEGSGITFREEIIDGEPHLVVSAERSAFRRDVKFRPEDTELIVRQAPITEGLASGKGLLSSLARAGCEGVGNVREGFEDNAWLCKKANAISQQQEVDNEALRQEFLAQIEETVRVEGGIATWEETKELFLETYRDQAEREGKNPDLLRFEVTENGVPTDEPPTFEKSIEQEYIDRGILADEVEGGPELKFDKITVTPLPDEVDKV